MVKKQVDPDSLNIYYVPKSPFGIANGQVVIGAHLPHSGKIDSLISP
jgi:hypothetical protein